MYIAGILQNEKTGRFHTIIFRPSPMPNEEILESKPIRHRSAGHHTVGFDTLDAVVADLEQKKIKNCGAVWEWDGEGVPAMTQWFEIVA